MTPGSGFIRPHSAPRYHGHRRRSLKLVLTALLGATVLWLGGLVWFVGQIPRETPQPDGATDAIVVLTGGSGRLEAGLDLMDQGWARILFVSGVYERLDVRLLLDAFQRQLPEIACCIELGYAANNTRGNAIESSAWAAAAEIRTLRLVTSNYHMPRALFEFRRIRSEFEPEIGIVPYPVAPRSFEIDGWWRDFRTFKLVAWEYSKFLLAFPTSWLGIEPDLTPDAVDAR